MQFIMQQMDTESDFQDFLGFYLNKYAYQSISFLETRLTFNEFVLKTYGPKNMQHALDIINRVDWVAWVQTPGPIPPNSNINYTTNNTVAFQLLADEYIRLQGRESPKNIQIYLNEKKDVNLKVVFNSQLLNRVNDVTFPMIQRIDNDLNVTKSENPEIGQRWYPLVIAIGYQEAFPTIKDYVQSIGRQKYILPVYTALVKNGYRSLAYQWYNERKTFYHPIAAANIRKIIFSSKLQIEDFER